MAAAKVPCVIPLQVSVTLLEVIVLVSIASENVIEISSAEDLVMVSEFPEVANVVPAEFFTVTVGATVSAPVVNVVLLAVSATSAEV